jgi:hypothetical protein
MFPMAISARSDAAQLTPHEITVPEIWNNDPARRLIAVVIGIRT